MWNLKYDTNEITYKTNRLTDTENKLMATKGERGGINYDFGISKYQLLYIR